MYQAQASELAAIPPRHSWGIDPTELLAVIAIIAVLTAAALRYYEQAMVKSAASEALLATHLLRREAWEFHDRTGRWPGGDEVFSYSRSYAGTDSAVETRFGHYISAIELDADGAMTVTYGARIPALAGHRLTLHPVVVPGAGDTVKRWSCGRHLPRPPAVALGRDRTDLPEQYLLHLCRQGAQP